MRLALLVYAAVGVLFVGFNARTWWCELGAAIRKYELGPVGAVVTVLFGITLDILLWPHSFVLWARRRRERARRPPPERPQ